MADPLLDYARSIGVQSSVTGPTGATGPVLSGAAATLAKAQSALDAIKPYQEPDPSTLLPVPAHDSGVAENVAYLNQQYQHGHALEEHRKTLADTQAYLNAAKEAFDIQHQGETNVQSADFLNKFAALPHNDPAYENKLATLFAAHPLASGPAVADSLATKHAARQLELQNTRKGGAEQFAFGSQGRIAYDNAIKNGADPIAAQVAGTRQEVGSAGIRQSLASGAFDAADLSRGGSLYQHYDPKTGLYDVEKIQNEVAARVGNQVNTDAQTKATSAELAQAHAILPDLNKRTAEIALTDPKLESKEAQDLAISRKYYTGVIANHARTQTAKAANAPGAPTPVGANFYADRFKPKPTP